jgi:hypothetical protein
MPKWLSKLSTNLYIALSAENRLTMPIAMWDSAIAMLEDSSALSEYGNYKLIVIMVDSG